MLRTCTVFEAGRQIEVSNYLEENVAERNALWRTKTGKDGQMYWQSFPRFDVEEAIQNLDPKTRAHEYASVNPRHKGSEELVDKEQELLTPVNDHISTLQDWYNRVADVIGKEINSIGRSADAVALCDDIATKFEAKATQSWTDFQPVQRKNISARARAKVEVNVFKNEHGLNTRSQADYPESWLFHFALLFVALVVEGAVNAARSRPHRS